MSSTKVVNGTPKDDEARGSGGLDESSNGDEALALTIAAGEPVGGDTSPDRELPPMPTISLPEGDEHPQDDEALARSKSPPTRAPSAQSLHDRALPPIPSSESPSVPRSPVIHEGIPLAIASEGLETPSTRTPEPPRTPTRTSSRNAPTSTNGGARSVTSKSLQQNNAAGQVTISSMVFVVQALETIGASKEARKGRNLADAVQKAVNAIKDTAPEPPADPNIVFEPLRLACRTKNSQLATTALDCIAKLISYSYFSIIPPIPEDGQEHDQPQPLIERAIETVCDCFQGDSCPDAVQLQIVKALLAAVLNEKVVVHGAGLLKAVRQTYNIFLLSRNSANQQTAQGTLTQMVHTVFQRVAARLEAKEARIGKHKSASTSALSVQMPNGESDSTHEAHVPITPQEQNAAKERITLQSFENRKSFDDERITDSAPTTVGRSTRREPPSDAASDSAESTQEDEDEVYIKDAFLVFRAMCKLSIKTLPPEQIADLKSHGMRSKLLSLHLIHVILQNHINVFVSPLSTIRSSSSGEPTVFVHAVKQYLCLSLSRNAASATGLVFEVCCEIFWIVVSNMRMMLKVCPFSSRVFRWLICMGNRRKSRCSSRKSTLQFWTISTRVSNRRLTF